jgi:hypothetical protein
MVANFCKHRPNIITLYDIMTSDIPLTDKQWFLYHECSIEKHESMAITLKVLYVVLPMLEKVFPDDKKPREALEAFELYIDGKIKMRDIVNKRFNQYRNYDVTDYVADGINYALDSRFSAAARNAIAATIADPSYNNAVLQVFIDNCL